MEDVSSYVDSLLERYLRKGLLIDANLLLLRFVGSYDQRWIGDARFKKLARYTIEDYFLLDRLTNLFSTLVTTPHVLTETSNLIGDLAESLKYDCLQTFPVTLAALEELNVPSIVAAKRTEFPYLGLTDSVLAELAPEFLVVTDDLRLVAQLNHSGMDALNFNHLREHLFR